MSAANYSLRSPAVKRLMQEAKELKEPTEMYHAYPVDDNLFEWHFTVRGASDTSFSGGVYHGRITLPADYPMKPPSIMLFTPNGRFALNKKICLSISGHHPETWQPSWSIRTALLAIIGFMPTPGHGAIGSLDYTDEERVKLATQSANWSCPQCKVTMKNALPELTLEKTAEANAEARELAKEISFKGFTSPNNSTSTLATEATANTTVVGDATTNDTRAADAENTTMEPLRQRRRRRVPRANARSAVQGPPTDYSAVFLNVCIVLCVIALGVLLVRKLVLNQSTFGTELNSTNQDQLIGRQMHSDEISPDGHRSVEPQAPPTSGERKPTIPSS